MCYFYQKKLRFLAYVIYLHKICMEDKPIKATHDLLKPDLV